MKLNRGSDPAEPRCIAHVLHGQPVILAGKL